MKMHVGVLFSGRGREGSALIGVLAALVFIGIVTGAMVKSTGSQSAAARSYGSQLVASSTLSSAIIATETHLAGKDNATSAAGIVCSLLNNPGYDKNKYLFGRDGKVPISSGAPAQRISSRLDSVFVSGSGVFARVRVASGSEAAGRDLKRAVVFAELGGIKAEKDIDNSFMGNDALYLAGGALGGSFTVKGSATFASTSKFTLNSGAGIVFNPDDSGKGDVYFNSVAELKNQTVTFNTKVYFDKAVTLKGGSAFNRDVAFNGTFLTENGAVAAGGNVWARSALGVPANGVQLSRTSGTTGKFNYTSAFPANEIGEGKKITGFGAATELHAAMPGGDNLSEHIGVRKLPDRQEPTISMALPPGKAFITISQVLNGKQFTGSVVEDFIKNKREEMNSANPAVKQQAKDFYEKYFRNDHLLIEWPTSTSANPVHSDVPFNEKVIFNMTGNGHMNMNNNFYHSGENGSTMVYVGPHVTLNGFGSKGDFRGLVYVAEGNANNHTGDWGASSKIDGAVLLKGTGQTIFNASTNMHITRNNKALAPFADFIAGGNQNNWDGGEDVPYETTVIKPDEGIEFQAFGYYFY